MTDDLQRDVDGELDAWREVRPGAYALARVLSLAARVEPSLVRRARRLLPQVDASAEADLWSSALLASHTVQGIVFDPDCAAVLRRRLAADVPLFDAAWQLIAWEHRKAPWPIRAEEMINRLTATGDAADADRAEQVLLAAARTMVDASDRVSAARWVMRAFTRLPPSLSESPAARAIHAGVGAQLDGRLEIAGDVPPDTIENWLPWLLAGTKARRRIRLTIGDGFLELDATDPALTTPDTISVPETKPLLVDVRWHDGLSPHSTRVSLEPGTATRIRVNATSVDVCAVDGTRAEVRPAGAGRRSSGVDFSGIRASHRPFVGRETELAEIDDLLRGRARVVGIIGPPGIGKTALLCAFLDRLESRHSRVATHFLDAGAVAWRDPDFVEASLSAQLMGLADNPASSSWSERFLNSEAGPVFIVLDDVESSVIVDDSRPESVGSVPAVRLVYTATKTIAEPLAMARKQATILLSQRRESNEDVCRRYLALQSDLFEQPVETKRGPLKAFVSYASRDQELARTVAEQLRAMGVEVWLDETRIRTGAMWAEEIKKAIEQADFGVVLATPAAAESQWVRQELEQLLGLGKPVLPLSTDVSSVLQSSAFEQLADRQFIRITSRSDWHQGLAAAVAALPRAGDAATPHRTLLDRCGGNIGRLVAMVRWIRQQPDRQASIARMPPTLYEPFDKVWKSTLDEIGFEASSVLGLLAVAKAPITLASLRHGFGPGTPVVRQDTVSGLVDRNLIVRLDAAAAKEDAGPRFALADESMRNDVLAQMTPADIRGLNRQLAEADDDAEYTLRYRLDHLVDAGEVEAAIDAAGDVDLLTRMCVAMGVDGLEAQLSAIAAAARQGGGSPHQNAPVAS